MKITSLIVQAFRGFNEQRSFSFENANIIVLYGPNGHGKSSVYDAIEWVLTGGIYRFDENSPERKRTRFIRNLNSGFSVKSFVKLGIILSNGERYTIERRCTATKSDRTDYGKHKLLIFDSNSNLLKENDDAESTLNSWLVYEDWNSKINSPIKMLSLTHILSQEKIAEFLKGMQERDRYDVISTIFGTDDFDKYREGFKEVRNVLIADLEKTKVQIKEKNISTEAIEREVIDLEERIQKSTDSDYKKEYNTYSELNPDLVVKADNLIDLLKHIKKNQHKIELERKNIKREYNTLREIQQELPNLVQKKIMRNALLKEQKILKKLKSLSLTKRKFEHLLSQEKDIREERNSLKSIANLQTNSQLKVESLFKERSSLLELIEKSNLKLSNISNESDISFLDEFKEIIDIVDYENLRTFLQSIVEDYKSLKKEEFLRQEKLLKIDTIESSIKNVKKNHEVYHAFLSSLSDYIHSEEKSIDNCPTCGTTGIKKEDILINLQKQQVVIDENLPMLEGVHHLEKVELIKLNDAIKSYEINIEKIQSKIKELMKKLQIEIKKIDIKLSSEKQKQITYNKNFASLKSQHEDFEKSCQELKLKETIDIRDQLLSRIQASEEEIKETMKKRETDGFLAKLLFENYDINNIEENEQLLKEKLIDIEAEINLLMRLIESVEMNNFVININNPDQIRSQIEHALEVFADKIKQNRLLEESSIKLNNLIEFSSEKTRLLKLQKDLIYKQNEVNELKTKKGKMKEDIDVLWDLINKSTEAVSNLNEKVFSHLKETIQTIFEQINSHPIFTELDLVMDTYRNNNYLTINVGKSKGQDEVKANAPYIFSAAQVNSIAISLFLAMSLKQKWSPLQLIGMDDPIQSMDELNIISFIDLMRLFVDKHEKQIIISTHDQSFYKLILKKFRYHNLATIEYESYGDKGPNIITTDKSLNLIGNKLEIDYEKAQKELISLDKE